MKNKKLKKAIDTILEDLKKNCISKEHRKAEINISCPDKPAMTVIVGYVQGNLGYSSDWSRI